MEPQILPIALVETSRIQSRYSVRAMPRLLSEHAYKPGDFQL